MTNERMDALNINIPFGSVLDNLTLVNSQLAFCFASFQTICFRLALYPGFAARVEPIQVGWYAIIKKRVVTDVNLEAKTAELLIIKVKEIVNLLSGFVNDGIFLELNKLKADTWKECKKELELMLVVTEHLA
uniref:Uncharacterized protein n=1 Tax=Meloidogyne floridensis TaxID=298350 RepID=A0A915PCV0_9BILA